MLLGSNYILNTYGIPEILLRVVHDNGHIFIRCIFMLFTRPGDAHRITIYPFAHLYCNNISRSNQVYNSCFCVGYLHSLICEPLFWNQPATIMNLCKGQNLHFKVVSVWLLPSSVTLPYVPIAITTVVHNVIAFSTWWLPLLETNANLVLRGGLLFYVYLCFSEDRRGLPSCCVVLWSFQHFNVFFFFFFELLDLNETCFLQLLPVSIPDVDTHSLPHDSNLSMTAGDFLEVYHEPGMKNLLSFFVVAIFDIWNRCMGLYCLLLLSRYCSESNCNFGGKSTYDLIATWNR